MEGEAPTEVLRADAIIVAVDAPALANMLGTLLPQTQGLGGVRETVARFWMDKQPAGDTPTSLMLMDEEQAVMALLVHRLQDDARAAGDDARVPVQTVDRVQPPPQPTQSQPRRRIQPLVGDGEQGDARHIRAQRPRAERASCSALPGR